MVDPDQNSNKYETISIESKIREGVFHKVVKDLKKGKAVSCSCKCWVRVTSHVTGWKPSDMKSNFYA